MTLGLEGAQQTRLLRAGASALQPADTDLHSSVTTGVTTNAWSATSEK